MTYVHVFAVRFDPWYNNNRCLMGFFYRMESQKQVMLLDLQDEIIINRLNFHIVFHQLKMQYVGNIVSEYG